MARWFVDRSPQQAVPSVNLRRLLPDAQFIGGRDWEITGCSTDTRRLEPGQLYVALSGPVQDGHALVARALEQGASGVVVERPCEEAGRLQVVVPSTRSAHARILHALAGNPSQKLRVIGLAGSRGKSAMSLFLRSIHDAAGVRFGGVGRKSWADGLTLRPMGPLHPSPESLAEMLSAIVQRQCSGAVVEFSEFDLNQTGIADGVRFDSAVFTQVCDANESIDDDARISRRTAYARLARRVMPGGTVIVNVDDPDCELLGACNLDARTITYGVDQPAEIRAEIERLDPMGCRLRLLGLDRERQVDIHLLGIDRVRQALAAIAAAYAEGIDPSAIVEGIEAVTHLPGRFEAIHEGQPFDVRIDEARSAREVGNALSTLRSLHPLGRVLCVVGSEGGSDRLDRLDLASTVETRADQVILTSDNPRAEDPDRILDDLLAGCRRPGQVIVNPNRREAIETALELAAPGDAVLIAGKGRHAFQILSDRVIPFDDRAVASRWLRSRWQQQQRTSA